jgi:hypothetical protein
MQKSRVWFPALPDFLRSSGSGTRSTQPREDNWGATWKESSGSGLENRNWRPWGFVALTTRLYPLKLALTSPTSACHSVGIVRWRTKTPEFVCLFVCLFVFLEPHKGLILLSVSPVAVLRESVFRRITADHLHVAVSSTGLLDLLLLRRWHYISKHGSVSVARW